MNDKRVNEEKRKIKIASGTNAIFLRRVHTGGPFDKFREVHDS